MRILVIRNARPGSSLKAGAFAAAEVVQVADAAALESALSDDRFDLIVVGSGLSGRGRRKLLKRLEASPSDGAMILLAAKGGLQPTLAALKLQLADATSKSAARGRRAAATQLAAGPAGLRGAASFDEPAGSDDFDPPSVQNAPVDDKSKDTFLAVLAHELRNPLAPLRWAVNLLQDPPRDSLPPEELAALMRRQVERLTRLLDDLLDAARLHRGDVPLRKERLDLNSVGREALADLSFLFEQPWRRVLISLPPEPLWVDGDRARLGQVLSSLLVNAAQFTPAGGRIALAAAREGAEVVLRLRDDGIGVRPEMLGRIFEPFVQADHLPGRVAEGLGIGLTLARALLESHGGALTAHSEGPGKGSEFVVRLPSAETAAPKEEPSLDASDVALDRSMRILICDDNVDAAKTMSLWLQMAGHDVRVVHDGPSALEAARQAAPEVVLLDLTLPNGMDGCEAAQRLRVDLGLKDALLVAVTGCGAADDRRRTQEAGFALHLVKPVEPAVLLDALRKARAAATSGR
jgi:signal transduction histidine kinase/ActR/RegA family two-component response regulator